MCLEALPSAAWLRQPGEVTAMKQNSAEAIAELLSYAAMDERSRTGDPNAAATDTLSLSVKSLWCPGKKEKKKSWLKGDSRTPLLHLLWERSGSCLGTCWVCWLQLLLDTLGELISSAKEKGKLQSNNS